MKEVAFFAGAIGALGGAFAVIALRNPFYSVLALIVHLVSLAGLFLILQAEFVAAAQVVVYAGAVMVLYVFVAAYVGEIDEPLWEPIPGQRFIAPLLGVALFAEIGIAVVGSGLQAVDTEGPTVELGFGSPLGDRQTPARALPDRVRGRVPAPPRRRGRRRRPLGAESGSLVLHPKAPPEARRWRSDEYLLVPRPLGAAVRDRRHRRPLRRSPLVILLCLELMLNAGNLALLAFARANGNEDGQVFAIVVMVVAACEVVVGLGLIVAAYRRKLPLNVDDFRSLTG